MWMWDTERWMHDTEHMEVTDTASTPPCIRGLRGRLNRVPFSPFCYSAPRSSFSLLCM